MVVAEDESRSRVALFMAYDIGGLLYVRLP